MLVIERMKIAGIIAEYNPFHNGHALMIKKTRAAGFSHIAVVMSGNFTQRGEAACMLKSARVRAALQSGADLVMELPLPFAVSSAENFAYGAVSILASLGCIDTLSFGSECGDIKRIKECANLITSLNGSKRLSELLALGYSFPKARALALGGEMSEFLQNPNDTLAIEYLNAIKKTGKAINVFAVKREGAGHDEETVSEKAPESEASASASKIRSIISKGQIEEAEKFLPPSCAKILAEEFAALRAPFLNEKAEPLILSQLRRMDINEISRLPDVSEGLEFRIKRAVQSACSLDGLYNAVKTKRYTLARIRRIILYAFLGIDRSFMATKPPYIRVLGFNSSGAEILREAKKSAELPIITRHADFEKTDDFSRKIYALECRATDLYSLCLPTVSPCGGEQKFKTIFLE